MDLVDKFVGVIAVERVQLSDANVDTRERDVAIAIARVCSSLAPGCSIGPLSQMSIRWNSFFV
jgi:hypothetical protein